MLRSTVMAWRGSLPAVVVLAAGVLGGCSETPTKEPAPGKAGAPSTAESPTTPPAQSEPESKPEKLVEATVELAGPEELQKQVDALTKDGKVVVVDFWATWCQPCKKNFPHVMEMLSAHADEGLAVITVSIDDPAADRDAVIKFLTEQKALKSVNLLSKYEAEEATKLFDVEKGVPDYRIYGRDGKLAKRFAGGEVFDHTDVQAAALDALKEKAP